MPLTESTLVSDLPAALVIADRAVPPDPGIDANAFPIVVWRVPERAGYGFSWSAGMTSVLRREQPFVLLDSGIAVDETDDDRQLRRCWIQANGERLSHQCRGVIVIEPALAQRAASRQRLLALLGALSLRTMVVSAEPVAWQLASVLLRTGHAPVDRRRGQGAPGIIARR